MKLTGKTKGIERVLLYIKDHKLLFLYEKKYLKYSYKHEKRNK